MDARDYALTWLVLEHVAQRYQRRLDRHLTLRGSLLHQADAELRRELRRIRRCQTAIAEELRIRSVAVETLAPIDERRN